MRGDEAAEWGGRLKNVPPGLLSRRHRAAWLTLAVCLALVGLVSWGLQQQNHRNAQQQFELHVHQVISSIEERLRQNEQILLGGAGLFDASDEVSRTEWHDYVARLKLSENYPGIQGVGYSKLIRSNELAAHIRQIRAEGYPDYTVQPPGERPLYTSIIYLEPFSGRNLAAFGYDMYSEVTRNRAMTRAVESGTTAISGKVKLVQENEGKAQAGFLMYVPVYARGMSMGTPADRMKALRGFVYSPYRVNDLMRDILPLNTLAVDFSIFDGDSDHEDARMYDSSDDRAASVAKGQVAAFQTRRTIEAYGQTWTVSLRSRPEFLAKLDANLSRVVLLLGGGISVLLAMLVSSLVSQRQRALAIAMKMTGEIRRNEERLRISEERFDLAVRGANAGIWDWNVEDGSMYFSPRFLSLLDLPDGNTQGRFADFERRIHPEDKPVVQDALDRQKMSGAALDAEARLLMSSGKWNWFRLRGVAVSNDEGRVRRIVGSIADVMAQREAQSALQDGVRYTQAILDNVVDGIVAIDGAGTISSFNKAAEGIFGYSAKEVTGRNVKMLMPEPYQSAHDGYLENYRATGIAKIIGIGREVMALRKDGSTFPMDLAVSQIMHQGRPMYIGLVRDITDRKRVERMKSEFVSTVSHELRTPLTSISGSLGLVVGGALGALPETVKPMLEIAHKNAQRLGVLIDDLLDMEKIVAGKMRLDFQVLELKPLILQTIESVRAYGEQHDVSFSLVSAEGGIRVNVDSGRLQQVLSNFLSNAAKFSPKGETVDVRMTVTRPCVRVEVIDRGSGIPEEFRTRIFQKFSQADSSDTRQKGGTGLGLAISKELIEQMSGKIGFESTSGRGSCFYFELPIWHDAA